MRSRAYRLIGLLPVLCLGVHCAPRAPALTASELAQLSRADALVRDGCYRCLQDAYGVYARSIESTRRPPSRVLRGAFDVTLLIAVRQKEIGIHAAATLGRARALLSRLLLVRSPEGTASEDDLKARLEAAEAIVGDLSGLDAEERQQRYAVVQQQDAAGPDIDRLRRVLLKSAPTDLVAEYLALAIACEHPPARQSGGRAALPAPNNGPPLIQYRIAICSLGRPTPLTRLREEDRRWTDAFFFEGKYELGSPAREAEPVRAASLLTSAREAFPDSVAVHVLLARAQEMNADFAEALASFDRILALKPGHVDAQLGRARTLSYLGRAEEGIAAATLLIERGTWHVGDAYYWRAWNEYQIHGLEPAWVDIQQAIRLMANTSVYTLAGSIAYARKQLDTALRHFDSAFQMDATNCIAAASAGLVEIDRHAWDAAAERFSKATDCYALVETSVRTELTRLEASALEPAVKERRLSNARKRLQSADDLGGESALNAAESFLHTGQDEDALPYVERAERHAATRDKALALRERITRSR